MSYDYDSGKFVTKISDPVWSQLRTRFSRPVVYPSQPSGAQGFGGRFPTFPADCYMYPSDPAKPAWANTTSTYVADDLRTWPRQEYNPTATREPRQRERRDSWANTPLSEEDPYRLFGIHAAVSSPPMYFSGTGSSSHNGGRASRGRRREERPSASANGSRNVSSSGQYVERQTSPTLPGVRYTRRKARQMPSEETLDHPKPSKASRNQRPSSRSRTYAEGYPSSPQPYIEEYDSLPPEDYWDERLETKPARDTYQPMPVATEHSCATYSAQNSSRGKHPPSASRPSVHVYYNDTPAAIPVRPREFSRTRSKDYRDHDTGRGVESHSNQHPPLSHRRRQSTTTVRVGDVKLSFKLDPPKRSKSKRRD
ncbi:hypothetical protein GE09DRAFT_1116331 [Coniochaeta sp. 2T2.1]|nr:hypothetical protein GE09DRAFT_1116331 [Coniochaeta sp. 2T2.1]